MTRLHLIKILLLCNVALRRPLLVVALRLGFGINGRRFLLHWDGCGHWSHWVLTLPLSHATD